MKTPILQRLPLGFSTFSTIRNEGYLYVDKTEHIYNLITQGGRYFMSRPRRFGKSLLVSTLKEILESNKPLFKDLWIEKSDYPWHKHGILVLDFSAIKATSPDILSRGICTLLQNIANDYALELTLDIENAEDAVRALVLALHKQFGRMAVLIDEYDSPILKNLDKTERANEIINSMRSFFAVIKSLDKYINFVFITGVSSFAKAGVFSGLNNLEIMTLDKQWATICGYTDQEVDHYFAPHIQAWADKQKISYDALRMQIKYWYNGYHFSVDAMSVSNPFSLMCALKTQEFENFWIQSGAPSFLIQELKKEYRTIERPMLNLESFDITASALGTFDAGSTPLIALLFQTGYLTITNFNRDNRSYQLGYPNYEVRTAAQQYFLSVFIDTNSAQTEQFTLKIWSALNKKNIAEAVALIKSIFVRVTYHEHLTEEAFYHGLLQVLFGAAGINASSEIATSHGRIDMVLELPALIYIIEIKLNATAEKALKQIQEQQYYEALCYKNKPIVLLGLNFNRKPKKFDLTYASKELDKQT